MDKNKNVRRALCVVIVIMLTIVSTAFAVDTNDASGFVMLSDVIPDAILEIRYYSTYNFVGERIDGYEEPVALLTADAAYALREVSDELVEKGYRLKIYDAYRPQMAVDHFVRWAHDLTDTSMKPIFYPDLNKSVLFKQGYIASRSGHSRGSTVDLTLFDISAGKEVDMGGTFDYFGEQSHPSFRGITEEQYANRMFLREIMVSHGFKPLSTEWWHFTLKDEPYTNIYFTFPVNSDSIQGDTVGLSYKKGMRGEEIRYYQKLLISAGYLSGDADGQFGPQTEAAVREFQKAYGLDVNGILSSDEIEILRQGY